MATDHGAFVPGPRRRLAPTGQGPLDGLTFAAKDNMDVAGWVTGAGNPDWRASRPPSERSAWAVQALLAAGAALAGVTVSDELAFSLEGRNAFDGTPVNPACPNGLPGGSSSGSAVAVAAHHADIALGTDTGGSVRVPASFCGIFGFRPSHGRVPMDGVVPLAPSYDTVGWFARSADLLQRAGSVLLGGPEPDETAPIRLILAGDGFDTMDSAHQAPLLSAAGALGAQDVCCLFDRQQALWLECYRVLQGAEIWRAHGDWIRSARPRFAPDIAARFADASCITEAEVATMADIRGRIARHVHSLVPVGTVMLLPTAPGPALRRSADAAEIGAFYTRALALTSVAGHTGLPQLCLPATPAAGGCPLGLSLIGWPNSDSVLLRIAAGWEANGDWSPTQPIESAACASPPGGSRSLAGPTNS